MPIKLHALMLFLLVALSQYVAASTSLQSHPSVPAKAQAALQVAFGGSPDSRSVLVFPGTCHYERINRDYLSEFNSELRPAAIFLPRSTADISRFVTVIRPFILAGVVRLAVRGGGQQPTRACNNIQYGITIDLRHMTDIAIDAKVGSVTIDAGARWGEVYERLQPIGLGVTGGRSTTNGIGGLVLAGGLSFFSSREGFITDNVINFEVVLASGKVVNANARSNPDLFKALRGGGNNFGVVTRVTLRTFKQGPFYGGSVFYFSDSFPSQVDALVTELHKADATPESHIMISIAYSKQFESFGGTLGLNQVYYTHETSKPAVLAPFINIKPQVDALNSIRNLTLVEAAKEQTSQNTNSQRVAYMNLHVKVDAATLHAASQLYVAGTKSLQDVQNITASMTLQPYATSLLKKQNRNGGNVLGLKGSDGPIMSLLLLTWWDNKSDDAKVLNIIKGILEKIRLDAAARGTLIPYQYMNYAADFQDVVDSYGVENKRFLQAVSKKYDSSGVFQKGVPGGWKLFA